MLYTKNGDGGTTSIFGCDQRLSKSSAIAEALGTLDELNSYLGICKVKAEDGSVVHGLQEALFIIQAQVAGADKKLESVRTVELEGRIDDIEKVLAPIKTFSIAGGSELSAMYDFARSLARRAERRVIAVAEEGRVVVQPEALAYLNRLSSYLYALARLSNQKSGIKEVSPRY